MQKQITPDQMVEAMVANRIGELSLELIKMRTVVSSLSAELQAKNARIAELEAQVGTSDTVQDAADRLEQLHGKATAHVNGAAAEAPM